MAELKEDLDFIQEEILVEEQILEAEVELNVNDSALKYSEWADIQEEPTVQTYSSLNTIEPGTHSIDVTAVSGASYSYSTSVKSEALDIPDNLINTNPPNYVSNGNFSTFQWTKQDSLLAFNKEKKKEIN